MIAINLHYSPGACLTQAPGPACDQCRRRKTKCDRERVCAQCRKLETECSYDIAPRRRGPRARVRRAPGPRSDSPKVPKCGGEDAGETKKDVHDSEESPDTAGTSANIISPEPPLPDPIYHFAEESETRWTRQLSPGQLLFNPAEECPGWSELATDHGYSGPVAESSSDALLADPAGQSILDPPIHDGGSKEMTTAFSDSLDDSLNIYQDPTWTFQSHSRCGHLFPHHLFAPYIRLFFDRLYPVFPVLDRQELESLVLVSNEEPAVPFSDGEYTLLTSLSAAVIVQLNLSNLQSEDVDDTMLEHLRGGVTAELLVSQCLETRKQSSFIEDANEWTILTSFFLFAYYGNIDQSKSAWYYLREAIGFAEGLGLTDAESYSKLDFQIEQRRKQIFWLLFITERAYAIQHRRQVILRPSIDLPRVFESQNPKLLYGFVALTNMFRSVDNAFVSAWREEGQTTETRDGCGKLKEPAALVNREKLVEVLTLSEIDEVQRLDVLVTQQWLRLLVCQLYMRPSQDRKGVPLPVHELPAAPMEKPFQPKQHIMNVSQNLLEILSTANHKSLEAHGIGMEQKVSDVAQGLCDTALLSLSRLNNGTDLAQVSDLLHNFILFLSTFRNHESQYLPSLVWKAGSIYAANFGPPCSISFPAEGLENQDTEFILANH